MAQADLRRRKTRRPLPPGQRLVLLLLLSGFCCTLTMWFLKSRSDGAQPHPQPQAVQSGIANSASANAASMPPGTPNAQPVPFQTREEMAALAKQLQEESNKPNLHAGIFIVEPDTGRYVDIDGRRAYSAASMIKLPVLVALCQALDAKQCSLDQDMVIRQDLIGGGSGWLQWRKPGSKLSLRETAELMMIISDNTATNMIIDLLGGKDKVNSCFAAWGLANTRINNPLPDLTGTNTTSPYDLACLLGKIDAGQLMSAEQRGWLLNTLSRNKIRTLLPQGIAPGCKIADKTGDIGTLVGDAGIITAKDGKRYIAAVSVERPWNDRRANALIRQISKDTYIAITGDAEGVKNVNCPPKRATRAATAGHRRRRHRQH